VEPDCEIRFALVMDKMRRRAARVKSKYGGFHMEMENRDS
jgi:hypothetical protein